MKENKIADATIQMFQTVSIQGNYCGQNMPSLSIV